jgi:hypothetical protein
MKKILVYLAYILTPAVPLALYLSSLGTSFGSYSLSVALGIVAYVLICNQFILAAKPAFAVRAIGAKGVLALHRTAPVFILILAAAHHNLKIQNGFSEESVQARFGAAALAVAAALILFSVLLMAQTFLSRIRFLAAFKTWVYKRTGLNYKTARPSTTSLPRRPYWP